MTKKNAFVKLFHKENSDESKIYFNFLVPCSKFHVPSRNNFNLERETWNLELFFSLPFRDELFQIGGVGCRGGGFPDLNSLFGGRDRVCGLAHFG